LNNVKKKRFWKNENVELWKILWSLSDGNRQTGDKLLSQQPNRTLDIDRSNLERRDLSMMINSIDLVFQLMISWDCPYSRDWKEAIIF